MFKDLRFLRVFSVAVLLHMVWDTSFEVPFYGKYIFLGFVAWVVLLGLVQQGLQQIKTEQAAEKPAVVSR
jgi:RsiW-degrading membrane proteinase PrsW (M82 family)